jgi:AcrR family transcriptional regulator
VERGHDAEAQQRLSIVLAAFEGVAALGYDGLRPRHVAHEAGVDPAVVRAHFPTTAALVGAVVDHVTRPFADTIVQGGAPSDRLHRHLQSLGETIRERPAVAIVLGALDLRACREPVIRAAVQRAEHGWRRALAALFVEGHREGAWAAGVDPVGAVEVVIAAVKGVRLSRSTVTVTMRQLERLLVAAPPSGATFL